MWSRCFARAISAYRASSCEVVGKMKGVEPVGFERSRERSEFMVLRTPPRDLFDALDCSRSAIVQHAVQLEVKPGARLLDC
eukprot:s1445_g1.t1